MTRIPIRIIPDPVLREKAQPVVTVDTRIAQQPACRCQRLGHACRSG